jgi:hypothetical protein
MTVDTGIDGLKLDEMIAPSDAGNYGVVAGAAAALHIVTELPKIARRPTPLAVGARKILLQYLLIKVTPEPATGRWSLEPGSAVAQHRRPACGIHRYVATAFEKGVPENPVKARPGPLELLSCHVGDYEAHAAPDVGSGTTRDHKTVGIDDRANWNAGTFVKIRREDATMDVPMEIAEETDAVKLRQRIGDSGKRAHLG